MDLLANFEQTTEIYQFWLLAVKTDIPKTQNYLWIVLSRHETINSRLKSFRILDTSFRHKLHWHKVAFRAVAVIVQYELENGHPLFDV